MCSSVVDISTSFNVKNRVPVFYKRHSLTVCARALPVSFHASRWVKNATNINRLTASWYLKPFVMPKNCQNLTPVKINFSAPSKTIFIFPPLPSRRLLLSLSLSLSRGLNEQSLFFSSPDARGNFFSTLRAASSWGLRQWGLLITDPWCEIYFRPENQLGIKRIRARPQHSHERERARSLAG